MFLLAQRIKGRQSHFVARQLHGHQGKIHLTHNEQKIFKCLLDVSRHFNLNTNIRVAGGWVRDKLRGKDSKDIDVTVNNMTGEEFCQYVSSFNDKFNPDESGTVAVVKVNPDQSKHLSTAIMYLFGIEVNFNALRTESYSSHSRIPAINFSSSPEEDALRRDFTVNSLFYKVDTGEVEDFTGKGIEDIQQGLIRTPLEPSVTLAEDPLSCRVMRAIRFAALINPTIYHFNSASSKKIIHPTLLGVMSSHQVHKALEEKVSRERVTLEFSRSLSLPNFTLPLELYQACNLYPIIFPFPGYKLDQQKLHKLFNFLFEKVLPSFSVAFPSLFEPLRVVPIALAVPIFLHLLESDPDLVSRTQRHVTQERASVKLQNETKIIFIDRVVYFYDKNLQKYIMDWVTRDMRLTKEDARTAYHYLLSATNFPSAFKTLLDEGSETRDMDLHECQRVLREHKEDVGLWFHHAGESWPVTFVLGCTLHWYKDGSGRGVDRPFLCSQAMILLEAVMNEEFARLTSLAVLLTGREIMETLQQDPSPLVGQIQVDLLRWQCRNEKATKEEAKIFVRDWFRTHIVEKY